MMELQPVFTRIKMEKDQNRRSPDFYRKKRVRCSNYSNQERNVLIHIIEKYQDVLEGKKLDKNSVLERDAVWDVIAQEFNDILLNEPVRTPRQLKQCYDNLKRRIKRDGGFEDSKSAKLTVDPSAVLRHEISVASDESTSSTHHLGTSSFQGSAGGETPVQYPPDAYPYDTGEGEPSAEEELRRKNAGGDGVAHLQRALLAKQIQAASLDLEMKAKKYELELRVEQAKLDYYKRKCELLARRPD